MKRRLLNLLTALFLLLCVAAAFWPSYAPRRFRYTGADPSHYVWNIGWPLAVAIYDDRSGIHIGPFGHFASAVLGVAFVLVVAFLGLYRFVASRRSSDGESSPRAPNSQAK